MVEEHTYNISTQEAPVMLDMFLMCAAFGRLLMAEGRQDLKRSEKGTIPSQNEPQRTKYRDRCGPRNSKAPNSSEPGTSSELAACWFEMSGLE